MEPLSPIYVDRRTGSVDLYAPLTQCRVPVEITTLAYGDAAWIGHGPGGPILIGVERKRITDLLQSMQTGRLSGHQLPGLCESYAYRWLLVEGLYREGADGCIEIPRGSTWEPVRLLYTALEHYLTTLQLRGGVYLQRTYTIRESAGWLAALWAWWTKKEWAEHRSHLALHHAADTALFDRPTLTHRMAAELPGIDETAARVAEHFHTPYEMVTAEEAQWRSIPGIGKVKAARILKALRER